LSIPTFGGDVLESRAEIKNAEGTLSGAVYSHNEIKEQFRTKDMITHGSDNQISYAANAYEFALLIGKLFQDSGHQLSADEIMSKLKSQTEIKGEAVANYKFRNTEKDGAYFQFPIGVKQIQGEQFILLEEVNF